MQQINTLETNCYELERIQNRQIRLELYLIKNKKYIDEIEQTYLLKNNTPPSCSSSFKDYNLQHLKFNSRDLESGYDFEPIPCPVCFDTIWRDTPNIKCFYCDKIICFDCYTRLESNAYNNNLELSCPLCRGIFTTYENNAIPQDDEDNFIEERLQQRRIELRQQNNNQPNVVDNYTLRVTSELVCSCFICFTLVILLYSFTS